MLSHSTHTRSLCTLLASCLLLISTCGCSFLVDGTEAVNISASPANAEIYVDNELVGTGSARVELKKDDSHLVVAKVGDRSARKVVEQNISPIGILDIVGGVFFLIPFIGLAAPGFWKLDPTQINLTVPEATDTTPKPREFGD